MPRPINFITVESESYTRIITSIVEPIRKYLPDSLISDRRGLKDAVNVHFFNEEEYRNEVAHTGINVSMFHGIADKQIRTGEQVDFHDYVFVPGPLWVNKLVRDGVARSKLFIVGYPKLDILFTTQPPAESTKKAVLYAPTHSKSCSSYPAFKEFLNRFPPHIHFGVSLHPYDQVNPKTTMEELLSADVVISDTSSIVYEAWALGKPVIFPDWLVKEKVMRDWPNSISAKIYSEKIGYHAYNFDHMVELIDLALIKGLDGRTKQFMRQILPQQLRGKSGEVTAKILQKIAML